MLVIQPQTLSYGVYRVSFTLTASSSQIDTYIKIVPTGLVISALKSKQPMYGGTIQITRGVSETIEFNPLINSYDLDGQAVISSLSFKYACQIIDSNIQQAYPVYTNTSQIITLDQFQANSFLAPLLKCFSSTSEISSFV